MRFARFFRFECYAQFLFLFRISFIFVSIQCAHTPEYLPEQHIAVFATNPEDKEVGIGIEGMIVRAIDSARQNVDAAFYNFHSHPIASALQRARQRGLQVRLVGDLDEAEAGYRILLEKNLLVHAGNKRGIQHNKFIIIDDTLLICGTGNFTHTGIYYNDNHYLAITAHEIISAYRREFTQLYEGRFSQLKTTAGYFHQPQAPATTFPFVTPLPAPLPIEVYFSPQESRQAIAHIVHLIDHASVSIRYMIFAFSHDEIASALLRAARRGVAVSGIHDSAFLKGNGQEAPRLYSASRSLGNLQVRMDGNRRLYMGEISGGGKLHCKTMLIDAETKKAVAITGSFNWSTNATDNNDENLLIIREQTAISHLLAQWERLWSHAIDPSNPAKVFGANLAFSDSHAIQEGDVYITEVAWAGLYDPADDSPLDENADFIEIHNASQQAIDLNLWTLSWSGIYGDITYTINRPALLAPGGYALFYSSGSPVANAVSPDALHLPIPAAKRFSINRRSLESVVLYNSVMQRIDSTNSIKRYQNLTPGFSDPLTNLTASAQRLFAIDKQSHLPRPAGWGSSDSPAAVLPWALYNFYSGGEKRSPRMTTDCRTKTPSSFVGAGNRLFLLSENRRHIYELAFPFADNPVLTASKGPPEMPVFFLYADAPNNALYAGFAAGLFVSTDNGASFLPTGQFTYPYDMAVSGIYLLVADQTGLWYSENGGSSFILLFQGSVKEITFLTGSFFFISKGTLYHALLSPASAPQPQAVTLPANLTPLHMAASPDKTRLTILTANQLLSTDTLAQTFLASPGMPMNVKPALVRQYSQFGIHQTGIKVTDPLHFFLQKDRGFLVSGGRTILEFPAPHDGESFRLAFVFRNELYLATNLGLYKESDMNFFMLFSWHCPPPQNASAGATARKALNAFIKEIHFSNHTEPAKIIFTTRESGSLEGLRLEELAPDLTTVYEFPPLPVQKGEDFEIRFQSPAPLRQWIENGSGNIRYRFFTGQPFPVPGDVIFRVIQGYAGDSVYFSNRDGYVDSTLMKENLRYLYFDPLFTAGSNRLPFPVYRMNDDIVQGTAVYANGKNTEFLRRDANGSWVLEKEVGPPSY